MVRALLDEVGLFVIPFGAFALYLALRRRNPAVAAHWDGRKTWLVLAGLALAVASLVLTALTSERHREAFVPTHLENGQVVPGRFR